jgi:dipeptidyl aminopeptidase/acylaminoacyl peptidase
MRAAKQRSVALVLYGLALLAGTPAARADLPPLIPREVMLAGEDLGSIQLSPDGSRLSWLAGTDSSPAPNIWVMEFLRGGEPVPVTRDTLRGINDYKWAADGRHLLYIQDREGDENWHLHSVDLATGMATDLTPFPGVRAQDLIIDSGRPGEIIVGLNRRDPRVSDMYRVNLDTGTISLEAENPGDVISWTADGDGVIRACTAFGGPDARTTIRVRDDAASPWRDLLVVPFEECSFYGQVNGGTLVAGFAPGGGSLYVVNPLGADRTRLVEIDLKTGAEIRTIASHPRSDVEYEISQRLMRPLITTDPETGRIQAVAFNWVRQEWTVVDSTIAADFDSLAHLNAGNLWLVNRSRNDSLWLVHFSRADGQGAHYLYDRWARPGAKRAKKVILSDPRLARHELAPVDTATIRSRDGLDILCYVTLPQGVEPKNLPLILMPHGGPWWRDHWEFDPWVQLLANRGYAVLQPQYRGSTGFGKAFLNAANREFGNGAVLADMVDAVRWAVDSGLADPERLAVMGGSAGGYAALCAIAFQPDMWRCAVNVVGPSSVKTLLQGIPEYWKPVKQRWVRRLGDAENDEEWNRRISPLHHAGNIRAPLFMAYGANDPRVQIGEAESMLAALRAREMPVELIVYPDEGHDFARFENNLDFFGRVEEFLALHLGGRKQPWTPVPGSSAEVR